MYEMHGGMGTQNAGGRGMTRREIMTRMRAQTLLVKRLREQQRELSCDGVRSLRIGGARAGHAA